MSGVKHTPWDVAETVVDDEGFREIVIRAGRAVVAVAIGGLPDEVHRANARMIAAAPDLLSVASQPVVHIVEGDETIVRLMIGKVEVCAFERGDWRATALIMFDAEQRAAITRATGDRPEKGGAL